MIWLNGPSFRGFVVLVFSATLLLDPVHAAVQTCGRFIDSSGEGETEQEAKKQTLDGWLKQVEMQQAGA